MAFSFFLRCMNGDAKALLVIILLPFMCGVSIQKENTLFPQVPLSERDRAELQKDVGPQQGGKEACSEVHETDKSLMGVSIITGAASHDLTPSTNTTLTCTSLSTNCSINTTFTSSTTTITITNSAPPPGAVWIDTQPGFTGLTPASLSL